MVYFIQSPLDPALDDEQELRTFITKHDGRTSQYIRTLSEEAHQQKAHHLTWRLRQASQWFESLSQDCRSIDREYACLSFVVCSGTCAEMRRILKRIPGVHEKTSDWIIAHMLDDGVLLR